MNNMAIFTLTDMDFFHKLRDGLHEEIQSVAVREFMLCVHDISASDSPHREYAIDALFMAHLEFQTLKDQGLVPKANKMLVHIVEKAHRYVLHKLEACKENPQITFVPAKDDDAIIGASLHWEWGKTALAELCNALRVGRCFGKASLASIVKVVEKAFGEKLDINYVRNRISNLKTRGKKSSTDCIDRLLSCLNGIAYDPSDDPEDDTHEAEEISA